MAGKGKGIQPSPRGPQQPRRQNAVRGVRQQVIPESVANRMARRIAIATGIPTLMGMAVFVASYVLVSRGLLDIPPGATLVASGGCFLLGLLGLSYGVLSASWEPQPGSWLGTEHIGLNLGRLRSSLRALRQGGAGPQNGSGG
ncbi:MAG: PAM68 family protein [Synechococcaceae cyanobacterium]